MQLLLRKSRLCCIHERPVLVFTLSEILAGSSLHKTCTGLRSRPIMPAEAEAGPRPKTCMHVKA
eukprot:364146-Chlamydomonas_euryale.AAC.8